MSTPEWIAWLDYPFGVLLVLLILGLAGLPIAATLAGRDLSMLGLAPVYGLCVFAIAETWFALTSMPMNRLFVLAATALLCLLGAATVLHRHGRLQVAQRRPDGGRIWLRIQLPDWSPRSYSAFAWQRLVDNAGWLLAIVVVTLFVLPMITSAMLPPGFLTSFTSANYDLGTYIAEATNLQAAGNGDAGIYAFPIGEFGKYDHPAAHSLLAVIATVFGLPVWKIAMLVLLAILCCLLYSMYFLIHQLSGLGKVTSLIIGLVSTFSVYIWYVASNVYLGQLIAVTLIALELGISIWAVRQAKAPMLLLGLSVPIAAGFLADPGTQLIGLGLVVASLLAGHLLSPEGSRLRPFGSTLSSLLRLAGWYLAALGVAALLVLPFLAGSIEVLAYVQGADIAGWSLNLKGSISALLGLDGEIGTVHSIDKPLLLALGLLLAYACGFALFKRDRRSLIAIGLLAFVLVPVGLGVAKWGATGYQTWKLFISMSPFLVGLALIVVFRAFPWRPVSVLVSVTAVLVLCGNVIGGAGMWNWNLANSEAFRTRMVSTELADLLATPLVQRQNGVNIALGGFFETIVGPAVLGKLAAVPIMPDYPGAPIAENLAPFACTVADRAVAAAAGVGRSQIVMETRNYVVYSSPTCAR